jgi:hypothetical protein
MAAEYWLLAEKSENPDSYRKYAMNLHNKATKLEFGIMDEEL